MIDDERMVGTATWVKETSGWLTPAERRAMLLPLVRGHLTNASGRLRLLMRLHPGRNAYVPPGLLAPPDSALTREARAHAVRRLPAPLLNHSYRTYQFGRAIGEIEGVEVDTELLFAASMLHDVGLVNPAGTADFTLASSRLARDIAQQVGLSTAASEVMQTAITLHQSPGVTMSAGPVAYLLSAGAAVDVIGLRSWQLPTETLSDVVREHPRVGFKREFAQAFRQEATRVPLGRAKLLFQYGAFAAAIRFAPFEE